MLFPIFEAGGRPVGVAQEIERSMDELGREHWNADREISECLDVVKSDGGNLPAGFSCFPGSGSGLALSSK